MKLRPVLLLTGSVGPVPEVLVAYISSVIPAQLCHLIFSSIPPQRSLGILTSRSHRLCACTSWRLCTRRAWFDFSAALSRRNPPSSRPNSGLCLACKDPPAFTTRRKMLLLHVCSFSRSREASPRKQGVLVSHASDAVNAIDLNRRAGASHSPFQRQHSHESITFTSRGLPRRKRLYSNPQARACSRASAA
jgi:hypothetical protein